jgi:hypothetical protein
MDFYKEAKVLTVPTGVTLDMSGTTFNHQGVIVYTESSVASLQTVKMYFGSLGGPSAPITITVNSASNVGTGDMTTVNFGTSILKNRLIKINNDAPGAVKLVLLN